MWCVWMCMQLCSLCLCVCVYLWCTAVSVLDRTWWPEFWVPRTHMMEREHVTSYVPWPPQASCVTFIYSAPVKTNKHVHCTLIYNFFKKRRNDRQQSSLPWACLLWTWLKLSESCSWETETGVLLQVWGQARLHSEVLCYLHSEKKKKRENVHFISNTANHGPTLKCFLRDRAEKWGQRLELFS